MAKGNILKGFSILSFFVSLIGGFFIGLAVAAITEAGKGQMLAGGAIVLFHGIIGGIIALCLAFFIAYKASKKFIIGTIVFYILAIIATVYILRENKLKRDAERSVTAGFKHQPTTHSLLVYNFDDATQANAKMGLGMFKPNFFNKKALYFYGNINESKSILEHSPTDSLTFKQKESGGYEIATAPPWFVPEHLKLDYDILYLKVQSVSEDFIEIIVNTMTNQTAFVDRRAGTLLYWPDFLLTVNSIELLDKAQSLHVKPFDKSGLVTKNYSFMKPIKVKLQWMYVDLITDDYQTVGKAWVQWKKNGKLLITFSLLS